MGTKVLFDTDIGSDIDDAVCLAYLLAKPECELLGITTATGEALERAKLASALCKVAGQEIPIFPGTDDPILVLLKQTKASQATALPKWDHDTDFPRGEAVEFLRSTIRAHPGEITLLAVGPLTNLGLLFRVDPEIPSLLKSLVLMCGVFSTGGPGRKEWNAIGDPHATAVVYRAQAPVHRSMGLDVTGQVRMSADAVRERFSAKLLEPVKDFAEVWFKGHGGGITFHDPLAATTIFNDSICTFKRGSVDVELASERSMGMTYWKPDEEGPLEVAVEVDVDEDFEEYFSVFQG